MIAITKSCGLERGNYDADTGRWLEKDPILFPSGNTNNYMYALSDPLNFTDVTGFIENTETAHVWKLILGRTIC